MSFDLSLRVDAPFAHLYLDPVSQQSLEGLWQSDLPEVQQGVPMIPSWGRTQLLYCLVLSHPNQTRNEPVST